MLLGVSEKGVPFAKEIFTKQEVIIESHKLLLSRDRGKEIGEGGLEKRKGREKAINKDNVVPRGFGNVRKSVSKLVFFPESDLHVLVSSCW